ncbi:N-acetylmuramoyl-L-alanine amidase [Streptomyces sp. HK10]|uniref:N-acetylmuramoyl-L-alanine amidase n=1 Tax=Streptomyces sp. HK10 TaxID=3373255 RepID=UPI00374A91E0
MSLGRRLSAPAVILVIVLSVLLAGLLVWRSARETDADDAPGAPGASGASSPGVSPERPEESMEPDGEERPLDGTVVVLDPGHNPGNREHTREIERPVDAGTHRKECDTTGTATESGYAEASFTLDVARRARTLLQGLGAKVEFTHDGDRPYGPCVDERARTGNEAGADAVVSVHADGSGEGDRGFHVILPARVTEGSADTRPVTGPSRRLGEHLVRAFAEATGSGPADYLGGPVAETGLTVRDDLGGLNLSRVPKVFLECGNMRDPREARRLADPEWRQRAARGVAEGVRAFLLGERDGARSGARGGA